MKKKIKEKLLNTLNDYKKFLFDNNLFLEGHFESEKYFDDYKDEIKGEFKIKNEDALKKNPYFNEVSQA